MADYLRNAWYAAAWSDDVGDALASTTMLDTRVVMFRNSHGAITALEDRCPHRFAPLSRGQREGDAIVCGYHGLTFDGGGRCIRNPFSQTIPALAKVRPFPVAERYGLAWIWFGDPDAADPALIPDLSFTAEPGTRRGHLTMDANYELISDNLMDLSHIEFVHTDTFGGQGVIFQGRLDVVQDGETVHSNWMMENIDPPGWAKAMFPPDAKVNHWLDMQWNAPASMVLAIGMGPADAPKGQSRMQAHILTPATESKTHYFYTYSPNADGEEDVVTAAFRDEDKPMLEAVQSNMAESEFWANKPVILPVDAGAVRARQVLHTLIKRERAQA